MIYEDIMSESAPSMSHIREQWEREFGGSRSDNYWRMPLSNVFMLKARIN